MDFYEDISDAFEAFSEESDRGTVLISAALIDETIGKIIRKTLIVSKNQKDELFEIPYAPLQNFSAKIDISYRLGLINSNTHSALHEIRKIRNVFAHCFLPVSFEDQKVLNRIKNILSHHYDYLQEIFSRCLVDKDLLKKIEKIQKSMNSEYGVNEIVKLIEPRCAYKVLCAFIYAYLNNKEQEQLGHILPLDR